MAAVEGQGHVDPGAKDTILLRLECMTAKELKVTIVWASTLLEPAYHDASIYSSHKCKGRR